MSFIRSVLAGLSGRESPKVADLRRLAEAGDKQSQFDLGLLYEGGKAGVTAGVKQDYVESAKWYRKAAEQGHHAAQLYLGIYLATGQGVNPDPVEGLKWIVLAKSGSDLDRAAAEDTQRRLEALMPEQQIMEAHTRAAHFRKK